MTPGSILIKLRAIYKEMETASAAHRDMWEDALANLDELIGEADSAYTDYQETDWSAVDRDTAIELREDQRNER